MLRGCGEFVTALDSGTASVPARGVLIRGSESMWRWIGDWGTRSSSDGPSGGCCKTLDERWAQTLEILGRQTLQDFVVAEL